MDVSLLDKMRKINGIMPVREVSRVKKNYVENSLNENKTAKKISCLACLANMYQVKTPGALKVQHFNYALVRIKELKM